MGYVSRGPTEPTDGLGDFFADPWAFSRDDTSQPHDKQEPQPGDAPGPGASPASSEEQELQSGSIADEVAAGRPNTAHHS